MLLGDDVARPGFKLSCEADRPTMPYSKALRSHAAFWIGAMYFQFS